MDISVYEEYYDTMILTVSLCHEIVLKPELTIQLVQGNSLHTAKLSQALVTLTVPREYVTRPNVTTEVNM